MADVFHQMTHYQNQRFRRHTRERIVPVTLIGGFLGSGKTTLVNHVLAAPEQARTDVLVREYGSISIDDKLIRVDSDRVHPSPGVSMHADEQTMLYMALDRLHDERFGKFDRLLLETSGTESPEFFVQLFMLMDMPMMYKLDGLITIVDAEYGDLNLNEYRQAREQIAFADVILINKTDLSDESRIASLEQRLRRINAIAEIKHSTYSCVDISEAGKTTLYQQLSKAKQTVQEDIYMDGIKSIVLEINKPLDKLKVNAWLQNLFTENGTKILRSKGFFYFKDEDYRYEFQAVRKSFHSYAHDKWSENEERKTTVVLIGENLPEKNMLMETLSSCV